MSFSKGHIAFKILTMLLVVLLWVPSTVKLAHVFDHHKHEICQGDNSTHIHKVDLDCEFQKFQINNNYTFSKIVFEIFQLKENSKTIESQYIFLSNYQSLHFSLRGPPAFV